MKKPRVKKTTTPKTKKKNEVVAKPMAVDTSKAVMQKAVDAPKVVSPLDILEKENLKKAQQLEKRKQKEKAVAIEKAVPGPSGIKKKKVEEPKPGHIRRPKDETTSEEEEVSDGQSQISGDDEPSTPSPTIEQPLIPPVVEQTPPAVEQPLSPPAVSQPPVVEQTPSSVPAPEKRGTSKKQSSNEEEQQEPQVRKRPPRLGLLMQGKRGETKDMNK